jgi:hypothetical protein
MKQQNNRKYGTPYPSDTLYINEKVNSLSRTCGKQFARIGVLFIVVGLAGLITDHQINELDRRLSKLEDAQKQED